MVFRKTETSPTASPEAELPNSADSAPLEVTASAQPVSPGSSAGRLSSLSLLRVQASQPSHLHSLLEAPVSLPSQQRTFIFLLLLPEQSKWSAQFQPTPPQPEVSQVLVLLLFLLGALESCASRLLPLETLESRSSHLSLLGSRNSHYSCPRLPRRHQCWLGALVSCPVFFCSQEAQEGPSSHQCHHQRQLNRQLNSLIHLQQPCRRPFRCQGLLCHHLVLLCLALRRLVLRHFPHG